MATHRAHHGKAAANRRGACALAALVALVFPIFVAAGDASPEAADPASDAPEARVVAGSGGTQPASYPEALKSWRSAEDVNAWIGARFEYDPARAILLSETQRQKNGRMPILEPPAFFAAPSGVCVDLSRFAVETLRAVDPAAKPAYVMIEFDPVSIGGNTLRRHWVVSFERDGRRYFFADSKRPGLIAGPYASAQQFIADYARYRGREIVSFREVETFDRKTRTFALDRSGRDRQH
jgi:hypothetical protein